MRRFFPVYANPDTGCDADADCVPGVLGVSAGDGPGGGTSKTLGCRVSREPRRGNDAEGFDRAGDSGWRNFALPRSDEAAFLMGRVEEIALGFRCRDLSGDRRSLAHSGDVADAAVPRLHDAQRSWGVPRLFLVLLHERARLAFSESSLPARLQHRPPARILATALGVAIPVERIFSGRGAAGFQAPRSSREYAPFGILLDSVPADFLHVFDDPGVLLHADLPGLGVAAGQRHG